MKYKDFEITRDELTAAVKVVEHLQNECRASYKQAFQVVLNSLYKKYFEKVSDYNKEVK